MKIFNTAFRVLSSHLLSIKVHLKYLIIINTKNVVCSLAFFFFFNLFNQVIF